MAILARGTLSERPMALIFGSLSRRGFSGALSLRAGGKLHRIGWQDGAVIAAESPNPADSACKLAITLGVITSTQAGEIAYAVAGEPGRDELDVLARVARLSDDVRGRLARRVIGVRAARALAPLDGEFEVDDEVPSGPGIVPIDARWVLYSGIRQHFTVERLEREVAQLATSVALRPGADLGGFGFGPTEEAFLSRLRDGEVTVIPPPAGLDPQIVHAVTLSLIGTGEGEIVRGPAAQPRPSRPMATVAPELSPVTDRTVSAPPGTTLTGRIPITAPAGSMTTGRIPVATSPSTTGRIPLATGSTQTSGRVATPTTPPTEAPTPRAPSSTQPIRTEAPMTARTPTPQALARPSATPARGVPTRAGSATTVPPPTSARPVPAVRARTPTGTDDVATIRALIAHRVELMNGEADHYAILGVDRTAESNLVRTAYFDLARLLHPDRLAALGIADDDRQAQRLFARINDAFAVLSTSARRSEYDAVLEAGGAKAVAAREEAATVAAQAAVEAEERYRLGEMAMRRQQADVAVHEFQKAVDLKPDEPDYQTLLGWALYVAARDKVAALSNVRARIQHALTLQKETALPHLYLGRIARMEGEDDEAARAFRRALEIAPGNSEAQAELRVVEARLRSRPQTRGGLFSRLGKKP